MYAHIVFFKQGMQFWQAYKTMPIVTVSIKYAHSKHILFKYTWSTDKLSS